MDKYGDGRESSANTPREEWCYNTCKFCWRTVPRTLGQSRKAGMLCLVHNLPAAHSIYRKHDRLYSRMFMERRGVVEKLTGLIGACSSEEEAHKAVFACLIAPNECLPRLAAHLERAGHDGTPESLLWAFHGPASDEMDARYKDSLGDYIRHLLTERDPFAPDHPPIFIFGIDELSRAEAWLILLDRDGRRKKSETMMLNG